MLFDAEELEKLTPKATHAIEIREFVPVDTVDPIHFDSSYYLGPNRGGERPYRLLSEAMRQTGHVAIGKYAARGKEYLVMLRSFKEGLIMQQLRYSDEVRAFEEVPLGLDGEVSEAELELAVQIVSQNTSSAFRPENFKDDRREKMLQMIQMKVEGKEVTAAPAEAPKAQIIDLMEALKASIAEEGNETDASVRKPPKRAGRKPASKKERKVTESAPKRRRRAVGSKTRKG